MTGINIPIPQSTFEDEYTQWNRAVDHIKQAFVRYTIDLLTRDFGDALGDKTVSFNICNFPMIDSTYDRNQLTITLRLIHRDVVERSQAVAENLLRQGYKDIAFDDSTLTVSHFAFDEFNTVTVTIDYDSEVIIITATNNELN